MKVEVLLIPGGILCSACGMHLMADSGRADHVARAHIVECRNPRCEQYETKLRMPFTVVDCEVIS